MNESIDDDNKDEGISNVEISNPDNVVNSDNNCNIPDDKEQQLNEKGLKSSIKNDNDNEELEIQYPTHHSYSYNITNLSNNREDLGAGFRSRLKNLNSPTNNSSTYSNTFENINPHTTSTSGNSKTTTTTTTTSSTSTTTTTTTHLPSIKIKDDIKPSHQTTSSSNSSNILSNDINSIPSDNTNNNTNKDNNYTSSTSSAAAGKQKVEEDSEEENKHMFECNICLDTASDPVVTMCGHFYCWPCIAMWLERSNQCPVCKSGISKEKIIPVYARGAERKDPREKDIPHRPAGHREEPPPRPTSTRRPFNFESSFNFGFFPGFSFTFSNGNWQRNDGPSFFNPFGGGLGTMFNPPPAYQDTRTNGGGPGEPQPPPPPYQNYFLSFILFIFIFLLFTTFLANF